MRGMSTAIGVCLFGLGALITALNFYLAFLRYPVHRLRGGTRESYKWDSGLPVFGSLFLGVGAVLLRDNPAVMWSALLLSAFDMGGLHWFAAAMLYMLLKGPSRG